MACFGVDGLLLAHTLCYFTILATGLATSISSALTRNDFGGACVLYGGANCTNTSQCVLTSGRQSVCTFITASSLLACVLYTFVMGAYHAYSTQKSRTIIRVAAQMYIVPLILSSGLCCLLTLVAAGTLTGGMASWCNNFTHHTDNGTTTTWLESCLKSQSVQWYVSGYRVDAGNYFYLFSVSEVTSWLSFTLWLIQIILYVRRLMINKRAQTTYQDPFINDDAFDIFT